MLGQESDNKLVRPGVPNVESTFCAMHILGSSTDKPIKKRSRGKPVRAAVVNWMDCDKSLKTTRMSNSQTQRRW